MRYQITPNLLAGGNINYSSFVKLDPSNDEKALQCGAGDACIGVSGSSTDSAPGTSGATSYHAIAGELCTLFGPGSIVQVKVGSASITRGFVKSDANGYAADVASVYDVPCAYSFESASANELVRMLVLPPLQNTGTATVTTVTADTTLTAADSGKIIQVNAADKVITLPAAAAGLRFTISVTATGAGGSTGTTVAINAADKLHGNGFTAALGKGAVNTQATARDGDNITVFGNGIDGYTFLDAFGTWARVA